MDEQPKSYIEEERDALRAERTHLRKLLKEARERPLHVENERLRNELNAALDHRNHDGWQQGCPICEREAAEADKLLGEAERNKQ